MRLSLIILAVVLAAPVAAQQDIRAAVQENFKEADANEDSKLNKAEFRKFIDANADDNIGRGAAMVRQFNAYDTAFARIDANEDGFITGEELANLQRQ